MNNLLRKLYNSFSHWLSNKWAKLFTLLLIAGLALGDFVAMKNLFTQLSLSDVLDIGGYESHLLAETNILPFLTILLLEGLPAVMGRAVSTLIDRTKHNKNDVLISQYGLIIAGVTFLATIAVSITMRLLLISQNGGIEAFKEGIYGGANGRNNMRFIAQFFLMFSPLLTSFLAFVASLMWLRKDSIVELEYRVDKLHEQYLIAQSRFLDSAHRNDDAQWALWTSLSSNDLNNKNSKEAYENNALPKSFDQFRGECFLRMRNKMINNCIQEFPSQIDRFNKEIERELCDFCGEIGFPDINIDVIIKSYDAKCWEKDENERAWNRSACINDLKKELQEVLNNAVVVAQFKASTKPYHMEGDY